MKLISPLSVGIGDLLVHDFSYFSSGVPVPAAAFNQE
jgi:hypothetical protein